MDITLLRSRIQSTVDPNADARRQAELDLRYVSSRVLLFSGCADIPIARQKSNQASPTLLSAYCRPSKTIAYASPVCLPAAFTQALLINIQLLYTSKIESPEHGSRTKIPQRISQYQKMRSSTCGTVFFLYWPPRHPKSGYNSYQSCKRFYLTTFLPDGPTF